MIRQARGVFTVFALVLTATVFERRAEPAQAPARKAGEIVTESATLTTPETGKVTFEMGTIYVPENRADPKSRLIGVGFARFKASQASSAPPTFHLPGGPGSSFLVGLKQENKALATVLKRIQRYRKVSDVVIFDQRGFSERGDVMKFKHRKPEEPLDKPGSLARSTANFKEMAKAAVEHYTKKGFDLRGYTVTSCADDVNDLRKALGYDKISLVGTSFGSQWSFVIMRRHPDVIAWALLSGVEPIDHGYDMPSQVMAAVQRMWWEAEKDPALKPYLPPGGLGQAAREVLKRLDKAPVQVTVKDPKSGEKVTITMGKEDFQKDAFLRPAAGAPAHLLAIYHEKYDAWATRVLASRRSRDVEQRLIGPLIDTSIGVTPKREFLLRNDAAGEFLGHWNWDSYIASAPIWTTPDIGDDLRNEVNTRIPVVFAQGDWDMQTPVENTLSIAPFWTNSRVLIAEHGGHGALDPIAQHHPKVMEQLLEFLGTGTMANLPTRVTLPVPKFAVPNFPAPAAK